HGPQRAMLEQQVAQAGLADRVHFTGHDPAPERWLRAMDVFVLPSYANEGVPQALMQAMMSGLPCITTDVGAISEVARDGETALMVRPQDSPALAQLLTSLLADRQLRDHLGRQARSFALRNCTLAAMCDAMEEVFRGVANKR
ncbi:MAG: glycosyltransferase, partial [Comamonadaceae bacterium]